jgi:hypothetical protein
MAMAMLAELISVEAQQRRYRVFTDMDIEDAEIVVVDLDDVHKSYTEGFDSLEPRSAIMVGKMFYRFQKTGEWPEREALQS